MPEPGALTLAHGWTLDQQSGISEELVRDYIAPAVRAVPGKLARRLGAAHIIMAGQLGEGRVASSWTRGHEVLQITLATGDIEQHDVGMELLICLGQVLWDGLTTDERNAWLSLLRGEIESGVTGEIDEDSLEEKRRLMASRASARSALRLESYAGASFAASLAEYIHSLWHDVTVRTGPDHLDPVALKRRLKFFERWFPPDPGYRLFP